MFLYALSALMAFAVGGMLGADNRIADRYTASDVQWGSTDVVVVFERGSEWAQVGLIAFAVAAAFGLGLALRWLARQSLGEPGDIWRLAPGIMVMCGVAGLGVGWQTEAADDVPATWVVGAVMDRGDEVGAELLTGYAPGVPRTASSAPVIPAGIAYVLDGLECAVAVNDDVIPVEDRVVLPALCNQP